MNLTCFGSCTLDEIEGYLAFYNDPPTLMIKGARTRQEAL